MISQHWSPFPRVRFEAPVTPAERIELGPVVVRVSEKLDAEGYVTWHAPFTSIAGTLEGPVTFGTNEPVDSVRFYVPNFMDYVGSAVRTGSPDRPGFAAARLEVVGTPWSIVIDQQEGHAQLKELLRREGGYGVGHVGRIRRLDGAFFRSTEVADITHALHTFLMFMAGRRSCPIMLTGFDGSTERWSEWAAWHIAPWQDVHGWTPVRVDGSALNQAFTTFWTLWRTNEGRKPIQELVHWYVESNMNTTGIEGSLLLTHTALELLAWMRMVIDGPLTPKAFKEDHPTSRDHIERVLIALEIPVRIPAELKALRRVAKARKWNGGPQAITTPRNWLVHPDKQNRSRFEDLRKEARWQALQLARWYLELGLLAVFGYCGEYQSRLRLDRARGDCELVPWA